MTDHIRQINAAIVAHDEWKARLQAAIESGSSEFQPETVRADHLCPFGQWITSAEPALRDSLHYERARTLHAQFHEAAAGVLALALSGRGPQALTSLEFGSEFVRASVLLVDELEFWRAEMKRG
jgi:Chemoreceptor zinc-binding domain